MSNDDGVSPYPLENEQIREIVFSAPPSDAVEDMRRQTKELLRSAALSLRQAYDEHTLEHEVAVEIKIKELIGQFDEISYHIAPPYSRFNMLGGRIAMDVLKAFCTTYRSDERFTKLFFELKSSIMTLAHLVFDHDEVQLKRLQDDLNSVVDAIWQVEQGPFAAPTSLASVLRFIYSILAKVVLWFFDRHSGW